MYNILIIGAGQLGLLLVEESIKLRKYINKIYVYTDNIEHCCKLDLDFLEIINKDKLYETCTKCDFITYEYESFETEIFEEFKSKIYPSLDLLKIVQDKYIQKTFMLKNNIRSSKFSTVDSYQDIIDFTKLYNYPVFLKKRKGSFDGRGNYLISNIKDIMSLKNIKPGIYFVEEYVDFDKEVSIIGCKNNKNMVNYNIVENIHKNSILVKTVFPHNIEIKSELLNIFNKILNLFDTRGIICVEFFVKNDKIYYNECCLRVHNSGHYTLNASCTSQFENHLRSIMNLELGSTQNKFEGIFYNIVSNLQTLEDIKKIIDYKKLKHYIKMYNKESRGIRKIGHMVIENKIDL